MSTDEENKEGKATTEDQRSDFEEDANLAGNLPNMYSTLKRGTEDTMAHELTTTLKSELAALEYKRDRLMAELQDTKSLIRSQEQRAIELQVEVDHLREQAARQTSIVSSLKKRIQELEERERNFYATQGRYEITIQGLQREVKYHEEKAGEYEKKIRQLESAMEEEVALKERTRLSLQEFTRRLADALSVEFCENAHHTPELVIHKAELLVQNVNRLRAKSTNVESQLNSTETELLGCKDALERALGEKEQLQRQLSGQSLELDRTRQEKECLERQQKIAERELSDLREKLYSAKRSISHATGNMSSQEALISQLREDVQCREEKVHRLQNETRHLLESLALILRTSEKYVEAYENPIKERLKEILAEKKDQALKIEELSNEVGTAKGSISRQSELIETNMLRIRSLEEERSVLAEKVRLLESELTSCQLSRESIRRDSETLTCFLRRLGKALQFDELSQDVGLDLQMESLLARAQQLARLETDKLLDKTSVVYQLQRRIKTLREQLQRRDLHLDLLRRKLSLQEEGVRARSALQSERDEANLRAKRASKQVDRLQSQLSEEKMRNRQLSAQLTEAADYKITALERARKIEDLQKRLVESEMLRTRANRKIALLKDQARSAAESAEQERSINDHSLQLLRDELGQLKEALADASRRESHLQNFRVSVLKLLSEPVCTPDYEIISRLQKMVAAHRDITMLSRRYDEPLERSPSRCTSTHPSVHPPRSPGSRCTRYEDSGFADPSDPLDIEDDYTKRTVRSTLLPSYQS